MLYVNLKLLEEPAFAWWARKSLYRRERIISKLQKRRAKKKYWRTTHKYGVRIPKSVEEALQIDKENGNHLWGDAIRKEMSKVAAAFDPRHDLDPEAIRSRRDLSLTGYQEIRCHIVFDCKIDFTRKARFCAGGHTTETPASLTYSSVVSRDSIRLAFLLAELNELDVMACDIENAYLNAPCREKIWFEGGRECGEHFGKVIVVVRALYGLKSSGASYRSYCKSTLEAMGYRDTKVDPDVYIRENAKPDGTRYYEYILVYVDDILCISHEPEKFMDGLRATFKLKDGSVGEPTIYLGANIEKYQIGDGTMRWSMSSNTYIKNSLKVVKDMLAAEGKELKTSNKTGKVPIPGKYKPELDVSDELGEELHSRYMQLIGILRWAVELGRIDIAHEVAIMSQYSASPREGHLEAVYSIFAYLSKHELSRIVFDPTVVEVDETAFNNNADWTEFYGDVAEELPRRMPTPLGKPLHMTCFVDANHAGNMVTRRSHTGILLYCNNTPIQWFSKKQSTVESSTFGSELVAMRIARDMIVALRIKLRMMGVPIVGPCDLFCDNLGVVKNTSIPESTLNKKHNAINYHAVREAAAANILRVGKEATESNLADLLTKMGHSEECRKAMFGNVLYSGA